MLYIKVENKPWVLIIRKNSFAFISYLHEMMDFHQTYCDNHFMMHVSQIIMFVHLILNTVLYISHSSIILEEKKGATCRCSSLSATVPWEIKDYMIWGEICFKSRKRESRSIRTRQNIPDWSHPQEQISVESSQEPHCQTPKPLLMEWAPGNCKGVDENQSQGIKQFAQCLSHPRWLLFILLLLSHPWPH